MARTNPSSRPLWVGVVALAVLGAAGCDDRSTPGGNANVFLSDDPTRASSTDDGGSNSASTGTGGDFGEGGGNAAPPSSEDPERLIAEADIVQRHGDTLYALSEYSGLSILDLSQDQISIVGRKKLGGQPFEMYVSGGVVYAMIRGWGQYTEAEDGGWQWVTSSHVEALDVSDPAAITTLGSIEIPGHLADSRMVGSVLYTVSFENGYCWGCGSTPRTTVSSFDASNPSSFQLLDQLAVSDEGYDWGWSRSISVTTERIYIGGTESQEGSSIHVVDISDPGGALAEGAILDVAGRIQNRWQMDEHQGVLRVISQPWDPSVNPSIQTFTVASSVNITPLGHGEIQIPQPESLRAVRFDGLVGYAITAEQIDPLFTIDLSDPANPVTRGELEIPGWIIHIEPRGDRLLTLGFDPAEPAGSMHVSLFDVSDLDAPTMIRRIPFGGSWGQFAEDQDRIHKAFAILPDLGLLAIPYSAWDWDSWGCGSYQSGVQLIDWVGDDLVKRGVADVRGNARRAFVHAGRLFTMSDEQVRSFSLANRDTPAKVAELNLSSHVSQVMIAGGLTLRLAADWWTNEPRLEIVGSDDPASDTPLGTLELGAMLADVENDQSCYGWSYWAVRMFAHGSTAYLVWPSYGGDVARVATVDLSNPALPKLLANIDVPVDAYNYGGYYWYGYGQVLVSTGDTVAQTGDQLVFQQIDFPTDEWGYPMYWQQGTPRTGKLRVLDLSTPSAPKLRAALPLPKGVGHTGLIADGSRILTSHWEPVPGLPGKARFYFDRLELGGIAPIMRPKVNIPGSLVAFDAQSDHLLTVDYVRRTIQVESYADCYEKMGWSAWFVPTGQDDYAWNGPGTCTSFDRHFKAVAIDEANDSASVLDERLLTTKAWLSNIVVGEDRVFYTASEYDYDAGTSSNAVWAVGGYRGGQLGVGSRDLKDTWWASPLAAEGKRLVAASWPGAIVTVDATDLDAMETTKLSDLPWYVSQASFHDGRLLLALGPYGLEVVDID